MKRLWFWLGLDHSDDEGARRELDKAA